MLHSIFVRAKYLFLSETLSIASTKSSLKKNFSQISGSLKTHSPLSAKLLQSCPTLCNPMDCSSPGSSVHGQEHWSGLPCPPPGDLPDPGIEPAIPVSPVLAGGFFTTSATWEAFIHLYQLLNVDISQETVKDSLLVFLSIEKIFHNGNIYMCIFLICGPSSDLFFLTEV